MDSSIPGRVSLRARVVIPVGASPEIIAFVQEAVVIYGRVQTSLFRTGKVDAVRAYLSSSMGEQLASADRPRPNLGPSSEVQARFLKWDRTASDDIVTVVAGGWYLDSTVPAMPDAA